MTTAAELVAEDDKKVQQLLEAHPELADDVEVQDLNEVEERLEFIVPQTDDPSTPTLTVRSVLLGTLWAIVLSYANTALAFRTSAFGVGANIAIILSYPMGLFLAAILPSGFLNPGPFSVKEHVLIYIMASCSGQPYGIDNVVAQRMPQLMNNTDITFIHSLAFVMVTQFIGYGLSGLTRRFLVKPTAMWWPGNLSIIAIFSSFHKVETGEAAGNRFKMSRFKMFWICFLAMFVYTWIPEFFMPVLQTVSVACLFGGYGMTSSGAPLPAGVMTTFNAVAGSTTNGVGFMGMTFDWNYIGSSWITSPWWAVVCNISGSILFQWILVPILYAVNAWGLNKEITQDLVNFNPLLNTAHLFNGNANSTTHALGHRVKPTFFYNVSDNYNINLTAYNDVAPIHLTGFFAIGYASSFITITAAITHVALWYGKDVYRQAMNAFRQIRDEVDALDKHAVMMEAYPEVPDWFYLAFLGVCVVGALLVSLLTPFSMPWWGIFFNLFLCGIFILPFGVIQAISGFGLGLNVLTEFVIGLMIPGQTVAVMAFKSWGTNNLIQSLALSQDLKLGHYLHIAPRAMVFAQFWGTFVNSIVATIAAYGIMFNVPLLKDPNWQYTGFQVFYSAGGIWGAIGPQRFFGIGSIYQGLLWCFLIGFVLPLLPWLANKYVAQSKYWHYVNIPLFTTFTGVQAGYQSGFVVQLLIAYFASMVLFTKAREFYQKYVYVMGAAFDGSCALAVLIISIMAMQSISFQYYNMFNPNPNSPGAGPFGTVDYYCWPGRDYNDWDCSWYLAQGQNVTSLGVSCLEPVVARTSA
ncbi:hypothetical protein HDU98_009436 [Podochytrium sp. JEL0797]|nr:hypothetical protein HDU98_009436 [Podochytrium sp. JEL0797]